jgi:hypothetical protein
MDFHESAAASDVASIALLSQRRYQAFLYTVRVRPPQVYTLKQVPGRSQEWSATLSPAKTTHTLYPLITLTPNMNI